MLEFFQNNLSFFAFILFLSAFLFINKKNLVVQGPFPFLYAMLYKTTLGLDKMDKWSKKHPNIFLYLSYLSIFIGLVGMIVVFILMFWQLGFIIENDLSTGGGLVLPLKTEAGLDSAVPVFYVPFWYWIIALLIIVIVHEFAHGVIAERFNVRIKSSGFAFFGVLLPILPGAFVEPDEKQLAKKPRWQQIAVFGAGSTSNLLFGALFLLLWIFAAGPLIDKTMTFDELNFTSTLNQSSLKGYGVESGSIVAVDGEFDTVKILDRITNLSVNETVVLKLKVDNFVNDYEIQTFENPSIPEKGMIGISGLTYTYSNIEGYEWLGNSPLHFERLLFFIWFLNIAIGIMNLLPIWITDGGQIARASFSKFFNEKNTMKLVNLVSIVSLVLIIFTIYPVLLIRLLNIF